MGAWKNEIYASAEAPAPAPVESLVLAANRTKRPDILNRFRRYQGGWDITNKHYWAVSPAFPVLHFSIDLINLPLL